MRALVLVFAAALAGGCFPSIGDGQVRCGLNGECPTPMRCNNGDGKCYTTLASCVSLHCLIGWCGPISDGCGHMIDCGSCFPAGVDGGGGSGVKVDMRGAVADLGACSAPDPCVSGVCGSVTDSCGKAHVCPDCTPAGRCSAGKANQCACTPRTLASCAGLGVQCGVYPDGCGGMLDCGACTMGHGNDNCGGGGPYVCGGNGNKCTPIKSCAAGVCGDIPDGCNAIFHCPTPCASGICGGGGVANRCG